MRTHATVAAAALLLVLGMSSRASAAPGEGSFTPTALRVPLRAVYLGGVSGTQDAVLYECLPDRADGGPAGDGGDAGARDCLVDMADDAALSAIFAGVVDVRPGNYDHVRFDTCEPGASEYTAFVSGSVSLAGTTFHTTAGAGVFLTADPALERPTPVTYSGCSSSVPLPAPVEVAANEELVISSFFSLSNIAWGALNGNGIGGCASTGSQSVCTGYPIPVAYVGKDQPSLETYFITEDLADVAGAKAGGQLLLLRDSAGEPFGGFSRRLYSEASMGPQVNYDTPIHYLFKNSEASSTYTIANWGGGSPGGVPSEYYMKFVAFQLATHEGVLYGPGGLAVPYRAIKQ